MNGGEWCYSPDDFQRPDTLLLADVVGLGKTIKASLIMRELKLRGGNGYDKVKNWFVEIGSKANVEVSHV